MASGVRNLVEEHQGLAQAWLEAEKVRVDVLQELIRENGNKCTMDLPENVFSGYEEALSGAAAARRSYVHWLAEQGFPSS